MKFLVALVVALVLVPSAPAITGQQRVLIMQVTWGPQPWPAAQGRESLSEAAAYIRSASFGRTWIDGTATEWLHALPGPPAGGCDIDAVAAAANAAAQAAGYDLAGYTKLGYAFPDIGCPWGGAYFGTAIWMHDRMDRHVVAHELGHTYGIIEEGPGWACAGGQCASHNYANPYSVMGHGLSDFNVFEKLTFGWIDRVAEASNGDVTIGAIDRPGPDPHALHVLTAGDEFWFEYRPPQPIWDPDEPMATPGIAIVAGPITPVSRSRFPQRDLLILDPVGAGRSSVVAGETFSVPGAFAVTVRSMEAARASVSFRWTDRKRPSRPRIRTAGRRSVSWRAAAEAGSGVAHYDVTVDRRAARRVSALDSISPTLYAHAPLRLGYARLGRGRHRVRVVAVDRAGNRSRPAVRTFSVR
jgi:hypothetical protein